MKKNFYRCFTLSGDRVEGGIKMENGNELKVASDLQGGTVLATSTRKVYLLDVAAVGRYPAGHPDGTIIVDPMSSVEQVNEEKVLVLVHEYLPGTGSKRWPGFLVDWGRAGDVQVLAKASRRKGSGADYYKLALVPLDWPSNIAGQFLNRRDVEDQTISYQPNPTKKAGLI